MSGDLRIGDAERDAAIAALGEHFAAGRLDAQEFDDRSSAAMSARSAGALVPLFADLPAPHPRPTPGPKPGREGAEPRPRIAAIPMIALLVALVVVTPVPWFAVAILAWVWCFRARHPGWHHGGSWHSGHRHDGRWGASPRTS
uniref:DUF1707 domain-containing protein n=1 Tax=uncultured Nocardioidaceae bacterium TaxID=253824 RepID=A0A6J4LHI6_9ACTN|nr:MAG: hypothetical protein AVDCRST_MAG46-1477 [uncultured Nocardioidaceae bacterium]